MKSFDQYLAESGQQSTLDSLRREGKYDQAKSQYESSGSYGSGGTSGSSNFGSIFDQIKSSLSSSIDPIVSQIKSQAPAISQAYQGAKQTLEGQRSSLAARYQNLLKDIQNKGRVQTEQAGKTVNSELARRGITSDSTAAQQEVQNTLRPIEESTTSLQNQAVSAQDSEESALANAIANLSIGEQTAQQGLLNQVAQILSGVTGQAASLGGNIYSQQLASDLSKQLSPSQEAYQSLQNKLLEQQLSSAQAMQPLQLQQLQAQIAKSNQSGSGKAKPTVPLTSLLEQFGG